MKKVMTFGTFDGFHDGHRAFLEQAKEHGDHLIVVVARDAAIKNIFGEEPRNDEIDRLFGVLKEEIADDVVMGYAEDRARILAEKKPQAVVLGYTQKDFAQDLKAKAAALAGIAEIDVHLAKAFMPEENPPSSFQSLDLHVN